MSALVKQQSLFAPDRLPHKPFCTDDYASGYRPLIRKAEKALEFRHIQPNTPSLVFRLVFDIDRPSNATIFWSPLDVHEDANLPPPNWISINPHSGNAHIGYEITVPVSIADQYRKAARFLSAIEYAYGKALRADPAYNGLLCKNPVNDHWQTAWLAEEAYSLTDLAEHIHNIESFSRRHGHRIANNDELFSLGRNCSLFDDVRIASYRLVRDYWAPNGYERFQSAIRLHAEKRNFEMFPGRELSSNEIKNTAKSIAKWTWDNFSPASFRQVQAARGRRGGVAKGQANEEKRAKAILMSSEGYPITEIATQLSVHRNTINNWLKDVHK
jgi:hypothetical protein